jgi:hypothetical protein
MRRMDAGEWLTRGTVWLALSLYVSSQLAGRAGARARSAFTASRWLNTLGCAAFLAHVAAAFHFYHDWSHSHAYAETARQTAEFTGRHWGGGLYLNYLFALIWLGESAWSWVGARSFLQRPKRVTWSVRGCFLFMMFNGAVVFVPGPARWFGLLLCLALASAWWRSKSE